jgi:hypothetical protein
MNFSPPEELPECDERAYWRKRFQWASWIFLFAGFYFIFTDSTLSGLIAITTSMFFQFFDTYHQIRHIKWHIVRNEEGGGHEF